MSDELHIVMGILLRKKDFITPLFSFHVMTLLAPSLFKENPLALLLLQAPPFFFDHSPILK